MRPHAHRRHDPRAEPPPARVPTPRRGGPRRASALLALTVAACLAFALPATAGKAGDGAAEVATHFALLAGFPDAEAGTEGVLVVPGTVIPLGDTAEAPGGGDGSAEARASEVGELAERLQRTLRLQDMKVLYTYPLVTRVGETAELPPPTATSPLRVSVDLKGYNPELATYRVRFREGSNTFTDSVVSVPRGKRAVVGGLDGEEAPYLFLLVAPGVAGDGPRFVGEDVTPPRRLSGPPPKYTEEARKAGLEGLVIVRAVIDDEGVVRHVEALREQPMGLTEAALEAIRNWRFEPARDADGQPVEVYYNLTINFRLGDKHEEPDEEKQPDER